MYSPERRSYVMYEDIKEEAAKAVAELIERSGIKKGQILVVGCSSSEVCGDRIGSNSKPEVAQAVFDGIRSVTDPLGIFIAAQCCEHLNRAIIVEREAAGDREIVNVVPWTKGGGGFATAAYNGFKDPVALEEIKADAGIDIGDTLIGMHLKRVAVPVRLVNKKIGEAHVVAARVRPKFIGGERAHYDDKLIEVK